MNYDFDFEHQERRERFSRFLRQLILWIFILALTIQAAWLIVEYAGEVTNIIDSSMSTALEQDDNILISKLSYIRNGPERYDVIVFNREGKEHSFYSVKRVIGLPGETVQIVDGRILINGEVLEEEYITSSIDIYGLADDPVYLDEDEYFVLGDNRSASEDSRFADVGNVVRSEIIGKAIIRTNNFGIISKINLIQNNTEDME